MSGSGAAAPLRVAVNLLWCIPGEVGGSEQYLVRQLAGIGELGAAASGIEVTVFATTELRERHGSALAHCTFVEAPTDGRRRWRRIADENTWLHARTRGASLVHHGGGTAPHRARYPYVLTVHDLQYRTYPEYFSVLKRRYLDSTMPRSARRAAVVTVPSEYVRGSVVEQLGVAPERVVVVPHGYEPSLLADRTGEAELRARMHLGEGPVLVYPAMSAPHKNHVFLVEMLRHAWTDPDLRLVLIGGRGRGEPALDAALAAAGDAVARRVVRAGRVSDADRNGLLAMAAALVFPSRYEGFGAPVIEAMALGAPVICSDATCLPEVVGDAGLVRPLRPDAWAGALDEAARRRDELVAAGHRRVTAFTSQRSGAALVDAYRQAVER